jgi:hypothetical protein
LKRIIMGSGVGIVVMAILFGLYLYEAGRRLDTTVAAMREDGIRVLPDDFAGRQIPDRENAAVTLRQINGSTPPTLLAQLVRTARTQQSINWGPRPQTFSVEVPMLRYAAERLMASATADVERGHVGQAIETLRDTFFIADAIDRMEAGFTAHLTSSSIRSDLVDLCGQLAGALYVNSFRDPEARGLPRDELDAVINEFLREEPAARGIMSAWEAEASDIYLDATDGAGKTLGGISMPRWTLVMDPLFKLDANRMLKDYASTIRSLRTEDHIGQADVSYQRRERSETSELVHTFSDSKQRNYRRNMDNHAIVLTSTRVAAIQLAILKYRHDHNGAPPENLDALVPGYLSKVPTDPFAPDGASLRYRTTPTAYLYSVGRNGVDGSAGSGGSQSEQPATSLKVPRVLSADHFYFLWDINPGAAATQKSSGTRPSTQPRSAARSPVSGSPVPSEKD